MISLDISEEMKDSEILRLVKREMRIQEFRNRQRIKIKNRDARITQLIKSGKRVIKIGETKEENRAYALEYTIHFSQDSPSAFVLDVVEARTSKNAAEYIRDAHSSPSTVFFKDSGRDYYL